MKKFGKKYQAALKKVDPKKNYTLEEAVALYDVSLYPRNYWESVIADENGELHQYYDQVQFIENRSVNTYAVLAKGEEDIAKEISDQFGALKEEGFLEKLSEQFYGYNAFAYNSEN